MARVTPLSSCSQDETRASGNITLPRARPHNAQLVAQIVALNMMPQGFVLGDLRHVWRTNFIDYESLLTAGYKALLLDVYLTASCERQRGRR